MAAALSDAPAGEALGPVAQALLDEIGCGLIVCDDHHRIVYANPSAQHELQLGQPLIGSGGCLRPASAVDAAAFDEAMTHAALHHRRSLLQMVAGGTRLMVTLLPLRLPGTTVPRVLVMLGRRQACSELGLELLGASAGLTLAERRVLAALVAGATPREIARDHGVALSTVRTQISSARSKLGARSIEGLLLRAAEVPPVAHALRLTATSLGGTPAPTARPQPTPGLRAAA